MLKNVPKSLINRKKQLEISEKALKNSFGETQFGRNFRFQLLSNRYIFSLLFIYIFKLLLSVGVQIYR